MTNFNFDLNIKLNKILRSHIKSLIFLDIIEGPKTMNDLKKHGFGSSVSNALKFLEDNQMIRINKEGLYVLSSEGKIVAVNFINFLDCWPNRDMDLFWDNHRIEQIPLNLFNDLYLLKDSKLQKYDNLYPDKSFRIYEELVLNSDKLDSILSICSPEHIKILCDFVKSSSDFKLNLIINNEILEELLLNYRDFLKLLMESDDVNIYIPESDVNFFLNIGNNFMSLNLFDFNLNCDIGNMMYGKSVENIRWARKLFRHCLDNSKPLDEVFINNLKW